MKQLEQTRLITPVTDADKCTPVKTFYPSSSRTSSSRYIVSLVVGYDGLYDDSGVGSPEEAARLAVALVRGGGTIWTVYDRETGETTQWEDVGL